MFVEKEIPIPVRYQLAHEVQSTCPTKALKYLLIPAEQDYKDSFSSFCKLIPICLQYSYANGANWSFHTFLKENSVKDSLFSRVYSYFEKKTDDFSILIRGLFLCSQVGVKQDFKQANELFSIGVARKFAPAFFNLGYSYFQGEGVTRDVQKAISYFQEGANLNDSKSISQLGYIYVNYGAPVPDYQKGIEFYQKGIKLGHAYTMYAYSFLLFQGEHVKKDTKKSSFFTVEGS
uniref:Sel1 domain-containing protein n=1 Tax=Coptotermes formosanus TaxID=36987 RepID=R4UJW4_COPFO|nr:Sel1 domain-containing protein [Coptotermes formosanus]